jgi:hypothetical protein
MDPATSVTWEPAATQDPRGQGGPFALEFERMNKRQGPREPKLNAD